MATKNHYLIYRGALRAMVGHGGEVIFGTVHEEGQATGVYFVELEKGSARKAAMPGAVALVHDGVTLFAAGTDGHLYRGKLDKAQLEAVGAALDPAPVALSLLSQEQIAVASGHHVVVMARADGSVHQQLELGERVTALAADPSGEWLVVGTDRGTMTVFEREAKPEFVKSASAKVHEGEITSLLFETSELRVLSTGSDNRLMVTHVRGTLEPEDRGGAGMHERPISDMIAGTAALDRFYTVGQDSVIKAWPSGRTSKRPSTQKDGVVRSVAMALVSHQEKPHLAVAGQDDTIRVFPLEHDGKVGEMSIVLRDAFAWAAHTLEAGDPKQRQEVLEKLAAFNDRRALELLTQRVGADSDHKLQVLATKLLGQTGNERAIKPLEGLLRSNVEEVRREALAGLRTLQGKEALRPLELSLKAGHKDIGVEAIDALKELASGEDRALEMLIEALDHATPAIRFQALQKLEEHYGKKSTEAPLLALKSRHQDMVRAGLIHFYQMDLLGDARVEAALRRNLEANDAEVRHTAFLVSLLRRPTLAEVMRNRDSDLNRQLFSVVESYGQDEEAIKKGPPKATKKAPSSLDEEDYEPLLEAMAARALDSCMRGATGLALLQDTRAFGTLLQLSRERDKEARVNAAQALEKLGDLRSIKRLKMMLRDGDAAVRDAAFSALRKLEEEPLSAAQAGLSAESEDVRQRGLQTLVGELRKQKSHDPQALELLARTLNDRFDKVRSAAMKAVIALQPGGSNESALRFANESIFADVRLDVLVEVMAQHKEDWAWNMLLEFFDDQEPSIRKDAFEYALQKAKKERRTQSLTSALRSRHADVRMMATRELTQKRLDDVEDLLLIALDDSDEAIRQTVIGALMTADAHELLVRALQSAHTDVQIKAAQALARTGDERAMPTLLKIATSAEPDKKDDAGKHASWLSHVQVALDGLAELGKVEARDALVPLIDSPHAALRQLAVRALVWSSRSESLGTLREVIRHADAAVQKEASLGLAYWGDPMGAPMIFGGKNVSLEEQVLAALGLLSHDEDRLFAFLDQGDQNVRRRAFLILLLLELSEGDGIPDKCLAALSSEHAEIRLRAARGLDAFPDRERFFDFVHETFNELCTRSNTRFTIPAEVMTQLSEALAHGTPPVRLRAARLLQSLHQETQEEFERQWKIYEARYQKELSLLVKEGEARRAAKKNEGEPEGGLARAWRFLKETAKKASGKEELTFEEALRQLVFGAYVGLSRERGPDGIRLGALRGLSALVERDASLAHETQRVLLLALGDGSQEVRIAAFEALLKLEAPVKLVATEALTTPYADMGSRGLNLLAEQVSPAEGRAMLEEVLLTKSDGLENEALNLLLARHQPVEVWRAALGAASASLRQRASNELLAMWDDHPEARKAIEEVALHSRFDDVRWQLSYNLASKANLSDSMKKSMFEIFSREMIWDVQSYRQNQGIQGLMLLKDPRTAQAFFDRITRDEGGTAPTRELLEAVGNTRDVTAFDTLLEMIDRDFQRGNAFSAALTLSGHDQWIQDSEDEDVAGRQEWMKTQHPRHDALLARLIDVAFRLADANMLSRMIPAARWSLTSAVDEPLSQLITFSKENVQLAAIEAIGWRLRHRDGPAEPLKRVLRAGSPQAQFLAAEALALAGQDDGLSVLLTAVNYMEGYDERRRAVVALGELGDPQALDLLLGLVQNEESYLRPPAAEALGHMGRGAKSEEIFKILSKLAQSDDSDLSRSALTGLRYIDTTEAWRVIRSFARDEYGWWRRQAVAELLGERDDAANRELLTEMVLTDEDDDVVEEAAQSLRKLYGEDSLEPDYIFVQSQSTWFDAREQSVERLRERGEVGRILQLLPKISEENEAEILTPLVAALLSRTPLPVDEVAPSLSDREIRPASVAAQIIGRAGKSAQKKHGKALEAATAQAHDLWLEAWERAASGDWQRQQRANEERERYRHLLWACGQLETGLDALEKAADLPSHSDTTALRRTALMALALPWSGERGLTIVERFVRGDDAQLREIAAEALKRLAPQRAAALLDQALEDAVTFDRLVSGLSDAHVSEVLRQGAKSIHQQGVVLGHMTQRGDEQGLLQILQDRALSDELRAGAIDGLATLATPAARDALGKLGASTEEDEDLRKAAWRALRRAKRSSQKSEVTA